MTSAQAKGIDSVVQEFFNLKDKPYGEDFESTVDSMMDQVSQVISDPKEERDFKMNSNSNSFAVSDF